MPLLEVIYTIITLSSAILAYWCVLLIIKKSRECSRYSLLKLLAIGTVYYGITFSWILTVYPLTEFHINGTGSILFIIFFYAITSLALGSSFIIFYTLTLFPFQLCPPWLSLSMQVLVFGVLVALLSYIKSFILFVVYYAQNISFGWYWLFGDPSLSFAFTPLADLYGVLGTTGLDFLLGSIIYILFITRKKIRMIIIVTGILLLGMYSLLIHTTIITIKKNDRDPYISTLGSEFLIIPTVKHGEKDRQEVIYEKINSLEKNNTIVVIPESVDISQKIIKALDSRNSIIIFGRNYFTNQLIYNTLFIKNANLENPIKITEKKFLMPFGEYMPSFFKVLAKVFIPSKKIDTLTLTRNYSAGTGLQELQLNGESFIIGLCSDFWSREGMQFSKKSQASTAFVFESNTLFHNNSWFLINLYAWHVIFAKTTHKKLIAVPNDSPAWIITP